MLNLLKLFLVFLFVQKGYTDCNADALKCFTDQAKYINQTITQSQFDTTCVTYKAVLGCLTKLSGGTTCKGQKFNSVVTKANNAVAGVCLTTGNNGIAPCATALEKCSIVLNQAITDLGNVITSGNSKACGEAAAYENCFDTAMKNCPTGTLLSTTKSAVVEGKQMTKGCLSDCGKAVGKCVTPIITDISSQQMNYTKVCSDLTQANTCLGGLKTTACSNNQDNLVQGASANLDSSVSDLCGKNNKPSACAQSLQSCTNTYVSQSKDKTLQTICRASFNFIKCLSNTNSTCSNVLKSYKSRLEAQVEQAGNGCATLPILGDCDAKISACNSKWQQNVAVAGGSTSLVCNAAQKLFGCMEFLKTDSSCGSIKDKAVTIEKAAGATLNGACGDIVNATLAQAGCEAAIDSCNSNLGWMKMVNNRQAFCNGSYVYISCLERVVQNKDCSYAKDRISTMEKNLASIIKKANCSADLNTTIEKADCEAQVATCDQNLGWAGAKNKTILCNGARNYIDCLDVVRTDLHKCKYLRTYLTSTEKTQSKDLAKSCNINVTDIIARGNCMNNMSICLDNFSPYDKSKKDAKEIYCKNGDTYNTCVKNVNALSNCKTLLPQVFSDADKEIQAAIDAICGAEGLFVTKFLMILILISLSSKHYLTQ